MEEELSQYVFTSVDEDYAMLASEQLGIHFTPLTGVEGACFFRCAAHASGLPLGICADVAPQADRFRQALMLAAHIDWATDVPGGR